MTLTEFTRAPGRQRQQGGHHPARKSCAFRTGCIQTMQRSASSRHSQLFHVKHLHVCGSAAISSGVFALHGQPRHAVGRSQCKPARRTDPREVGREAKARQLTTSKASVSVSTRACRPCRLRNFSATAACWMKAAFCPRCPHSSRPARGSKWQTPHRAGHRRSHIQQTRTPCRSRLAGAAPDGTSGATRRPGCRAGGGQHSCGSRTAVRL